MATQEEKQDLLLKNVRQDIQIEYFFCLAWKLEFMNKEQWRVEYMDVWSIELVADRLRYTKFWQQQYALFQCDN
jgi:hypothetical protein